MGYDASHIPNYLNINYHEERKNVMSAEERNKLVGNFGAIFNGDIENITVDDLISMTTANTVVSTTPIQEEVKPNIQTSIGTWPRLRTSFDNVVSKPIVPEMPKEEKQLVPQTIDSKPMDEDYDDYEQELARRLEAEMENKRRADVQRVAAASACTKTDYISNQKCAGYTLRYNGHCPICDKKCNGYISSENVVETKMVDTAALCIMGRKDPNVMYVSNTDIQSLLSGKMAIVTPDGTSIVFNGRK